MSEAKNEKRAYRLQLIQRGVQLERPRQPCCEGELQSIYVNPDHTSSVIIVPVMDVVCNVSCDFSILTFAMFFLGGIECSGEGQGNSCTLPGRCVKANTPISTSIGPYDPEEFISFIRLV